MQTKRELWLAAAAIAIITVGYLTAVNQSGVPAASGLLGHGLGIAGFILMLMTETLYSLRKRAIRRPWGRMRDWLQFHIFTGIVGPYMVFLHTAWEFRGLAGIVLLLTGLVVLSGFIGRYIYTAVPRTADGLLVEARSLQARITEIEAELAQLDPQNTPAPAVSQTSSASPERRLFGRFVDDLKWWGGWFQRRRMPPEVAQRLEVIERARRQRAELMRQIDTMAAARRLLSIWHSVHIPIGMALFVAAGAHIVAALHFATLLK
jgi:hypothetical protein